MLELVDENGKKLFLVAQIIKYFKEVSGSDQKIHKKARTVIYTVYNDEIYVLDDVYRVVNIMLGKPVEDLKTVKTEVVNLFNEE